MSNLSPSIGVVIRSIEELRDSVMQWEKLSKIALGFKKTIEHKQIRFNVSARFVIADLAPLAYMDLVQEIDDSDSEGAAASLYERLGPLLDCKHQWLPITSSTHGQLFRQHLKMSVGSVVHMCVSCTGYGVQAAESTLPVVGRGVRIQSV